MLLAFTADSKDDVNIDTSKERYISFTDGEKRRTDAAAMLMPAKRQRLYAHES